jgi:hypothetical protein
MKPAMKNSAAEITAGEEAAKDRFHGVSLLPSFQL